MPLEIIRNDITRVHADAIVNAANPTLLGGGGVDGAIHQAAGGDLLLECQTIAGCGVGEAKITRGYNLPSKYVIHTVGPIWQGGDQNEEELLYSCYMNSLLLAKKFDFDSIAFPLISSGAYEFPKDIALKIAISAIGDFLFENEMIVYLVVYDKNAYKLSEKLFASIKTYIDDNYIEEHYIGRNRYREDLLSHPSFMEVKEVVKEESISKRSLKDIINQIDETFSQMLLRLIDHKNMTDVEVYKRANIDRKHFSKIRNDIYYKPGKPTALAFAIALQLNIDETKDLLQKAGFALSPSSKFDIIIQYFIEEENYNIFEINEALFAFDQNPLGI